MATDHEQQQQQQRRFPHVTISGRTPAELGDSHGSQLKTRVRQCVAFYHGWFLRLGLTETQLRETANRFKASLRRFQGGRYAEEIEAIAAAAGLQEWKLYMLNARTEIVNSMTAMVAQECTSLCCPATGLLSQNWDWVHNLEALTVVMRIEQADRAPIVMITEPGIIGKIGLNGNGLGVCLNLLKPTHQASHPTRGLAGVPVHVLLRVVLDSPNLDAAIESVRGAPRGWASTSVLVCMQPGAAAAIELDSDGLAVFYHDASPLLRTNHFVGRLGSPSSMERFKRGTAILAGWSTMGDLADVQRLLADDETETGLPIRRPFTLDVVRGVTVGTITSVIMDLNTKILHYTPGSPCSNTYLLAKL